MSNQQSFIEKIAPLAIADWQQHHILPSLTIAQAIVESAWGTSELAVNANNLFGIKGGDSRWSGPVYKKVTKEWVNGQYIDVSAPFRQYGSWAESVTDHGVFLQQAHYAEVRGETDYRKACQAIKDAGYATSPTYVATLVSTIETYSLMTYDGGAAAKPVGGNSPLISGAYTNHSKRNHPRQNKILKITPHHCAGNTTFEGMKNIIDGPREMSCNYLIQSDGKIFLFVNEEDRSWCSSSAANDHQAVTIEVANDGGAPNWHVSDKALAALIDLCVDICQRNGIAALNFTGDARGNLTQHNYFSATICPGPYLKSKFPYIAETVNKRLRACPAPMPEGGDTMQAFDVFNGDKINVQGFSAPDVNKVVANHIPNGRYMVYESSIPLAGSSLTGALIRYAGQRIYVPIRSDATEITSISVSDAEARWEWFKAGGGTSHADCQAALAVEKARADKAEQALVQINDQMGRIHTAVNSLSALFQ